jgi:predicted ArsR family transcriptional regulator
MEIKMKNQKYRPNKLSKGTVEYLCMAYKEGTLNIQQEAKKLGVSRKAVYFHLHSHGLIKKPSLWQRMIKYFRV